MVGEIFDEAPGRNENMVGSLNMKERICDGGKYIFGSESIGLPVSISNIPETISVEGLTLFRKSSFHVTLVALGKIIEKYTMTAPDFLERGVADFCEFVREHEVKFHRFREEFRFAFEGERCSLVVLCDVSNLNEFFDRMNVRYDLNLEYPPTHVTLYTLQLDKGIFLTDRKDIDQKTKVIKNPGIKLVEEFPQKI